MWHVPELIYDLAVSFAIDDVIREQHAKSRLAPHWKLPVAISFGRCALAAAIKAAKGFERLPLGLSLAYWRRQAELAQKAQDAIEAFTKHWKANRKFRIIMKDEDLGLAGVARDLFAGIANQDRENLQKMGKNEGDRPKREFVFLMAGAWRELTGKMPGWSDDEGRNPFLRFIAAGWRDVGLTNKENFTQHLRVARRRLKDMSSADVLFLLDVYAPRGSTDPRRK
jgi:hypothetical protein